MTYRVGGGAIYRYICTLTNRQSFCNTVVNFNAIFCVFCPVFLTSLFKVKECQNVYNTLFSHSNYMCRAYRHNTQPRVMRSTGVLITFLSVSLSLSGTDRIQTRIWDGSSGGTQGIGILVCSNDSGTLHCYTPYLPHTLLWRINGDLKPHLNT